MENELSHTKRRQII